MTKRLVKRLAYRRVNTYIKYVYSEMFKSAYLNDLIYECLKLEYAKMLGANEIKDTISATSKIEVFNFNLNLERDLSLLTSIEVVTKKLDCGQDFLVELNALQCMTTGTFLNKRNLYRDVFSEIDTALKVNFEAKIESFLLNAESNN